ncbi:TlpA family protein disulfide reductase [Pseudomonas sp. MAFF 302030]|jgi:thiol-disulfide isomerase/thioredoxin|uniref:TlpA family protein disulfide reductase n=1 Tax=Pseudomonas morbosilactucae TaxID=2938197 RepID=A0A9X1YSV2_9PSED|nr:TlpA disulfide reductase family protein [Pseudomonas morbosilactucae]MCK9797550.1 TlpA family protein disulfide reductase [Pseudomonas morbosilactucae]MCK9814099.1 TlpA family protein disulfide reductase [Pseudomonas morbosilactucae]WEK08672.1 MAG: TlpA disulfide reductase family protein [Pseudomonas sp.]
MTRQLAAALAIFGTLLLSGCGNDYGVDQHGQKVSAERVDKHWLVLNYWAEWCGPCRTEIPELNALSEQLKGQPVTVLGVNFDNVQGEELKSVSEKLGIKFTVLAQDPAEHFELPRSEALPVTFIIDDKGKVREQLMGEQTAAGVTAKLQALRSAQ